MAVVTNIDWLTKALNALKFIVPCPVRAFLLKDRAAAEAWIAS